MRDIICSNWKLSCEQMKAQDEGGLTPTIFSLQEAAIGGRLDCGNGQFINPGAIALNLEGAKTSAVYLRNGFRGKRNEGQVKHQGSCPRIAAEPCIDI